MRAIILAAGEGKRLRPMTKSRPKCLVEYQGKPILDYQLEVIRACNIQDIILVAGYKAESFKGYGLKTVLNPNYDTTNMVHTLFCAEPYLEGDIIISYGDIIYDISILKTLLQSGAPFAVAVSTRWRELWEKRMEDPLSDAETLKLDENGRILELGKKPRSYEEIQGQYMGLIKLKPEAVHKIRMLYHGMDTRQLYDGKDFKNMYMTSFIQILIDQGIKIDSVPVKGHWLEFDSPEDLQLASPVLIE